MKFPPAIEKLSRDHWIMQVPVISTSHFTKDECDALMDFKEALFLNKTYDSAVIAIEDVDEFTDLSEETRALFRQFHALGYRYLRIDPDGMEVEGLKTYEW